jgi:hypothetical protein
MPRTSSKTIRLKIPVVTKRSAMKSPPPRPPRWEEEEGFTVRELEGEEFRTYEMVRELLASFEQAALFHYLSGRTPQQRARRADRIKKHIAAFLKTEIGARDLGDWCPPGWCVINGGCVPPPCIEG